MPLELLFSRCILLSCLPAIHLYGGYGLSQGCTRPTQSPLNVKALDTMDTIEPLMRQNAIKQKI